MFYKEYFTFRPLNLSCWRVVLNRKSVITCGKAVIMKQKLVKVFGLQHILDGVAPKKKKRNRTVLRVATIFILLVLLFIYHEQTVHFIHCCNLK